MKFLQKLVKGLMLPVVVFSWASVIIYVRRQCREEKSRV